MFEMDGIMYGGTPGDDVRVVAARDVGDFILLVTFDTGETRLVDCTELFALPAFRRLADPAVFATLAVEDGALTWLDGKVDIAPEGLYARSYEYPATA